MRGPERWWATGLTLTLHAGFLCWAWSETSPRVATTSVVYVDAVLLPATVLALQPETTPGNTQTRQYADPSPATPRGNTLAPRPSSTYIKPAEPEIESEPIGYLPFDAVDQAAEPLGDWMIDTDVLPPSRSLHVILKLWISPTGVVDHWSFSGVAGDDEILVRRAFARLPATLIQPAFLNHLPVPSFRQLEMVLVR